MEPLIVKATHEGDRLYNWKGDDYPSVTSIISHGVAKPGLVQWAANKVTEIALDNRVELATLSKARGKKVIDAIWHGERDAAAGKGTAVHEAAEKYALGQRVDLTPEIQGYVQAFDNFLYDFKPEFLLTEALVISRTYGYAGTLDAVVTIEGKTYILDIKTGNYVWSEVALQLAAYARADLTGDRTTGVESPLPPLDKRGLVLHLQPDGYTLRKVRMDDDVFNAFLASNDMYQWSTEISKSVLLPAWVKNET